MDTGLHITAVKRYKIGILALAILTGTCFSCNREAGHRILYVNSYHDGYPSSDDIREGIMEVLEGAQVELEICYLDSKQHPEKERVDRKVAEVVKKIERFRPDLVIASDDNAVALVVKPYLDGTETPVVFCGVNWSAEKYALGSNVTGMLEVYPLRECIRTIRELNPDIRRLAVLSEDTPSEARNTELLDTLYTHMGFEVEYRLVDDFGQWKKAFRKVSLSSDLIYLPTNGAIRGWDREEAKAFVEENLNVPTITCDDFMMDYCVFGLTKVAREQGEWAAATALRILGGTDPSSIPYARCSRWHAYLNKRLADGIGFNLLREPECEFTVLE